MGQFNDLYCNKKVSNHPFQRWKLNNPTALAIVLSQSLHYSFNSKGGAKVVTF